ncbi:hypothetical protein FRC10_002089 [Ceratobasidium sp. 414]|nr:hypothetical protein FRC10_002089 [Ceratobasidium sp. 414]
MAQTFWGYPAPEDRLTATAIRYNYRFAHGGGAGLFMAFKIFDGLEIFGPLRVMSGRLNADQGVVFVLGRDNSSMDSIPNELRAPLEEMFGYPPRLFTWEEDKGMFTSPRVDGDDGEVDVLRRGGELKRRKKA